MPEKFFEPDMSFRPAPFWAVNDRLEPGEVVRQFEEMVRSGYSGGFFHSRTGLLTEYLGAEWFAAVEAGVGAAEKVGGHLWLYDEDQWPSGNVGGLVAAMDERYRSATIVAELVPSWLAARPHGEEFPLAAYRVVGRSGAGTVGTERIDLDGALPAQDGERMILRRRYEPKMAWFNGQSPVNLLEPEVTVEFLRRTHEVYKERIGGAFGKSVPGIFTDEPNLNITGSGFPWWEGMPQAYAQWTGRDFWDDAPGMFLDGPAARAARLHIHRTILRQFVENYSKPVYEWCDRNGLVSTGHFLEESTFAWQLKATWGGIMAHYRWLHMPGLDHLCRQLQVDLPLLLAGKQVSSAARQLGRSRVLLEAFACIRHSSTMEDFRWLADANLALGANFFCTHMQVYSMRGRRKRDYPPNLGEPQTYWQDIGDLNTYVSRLCYALTCGEAAPDLLILHPIQNAMADHRLGFEQSGALSASDQPGAESGAAQQWDVPFRRIVETALNAGFDCDLGDEGLLADLGQVDGHCLRVGKMAYPVVLVPSSRAWSRPTFDLLKRFVASGGKLVFVGLQPTEIDCAPAGTEWADLAGHCAGSIPCSTPALQAALDRLMPEAIRVRAEDGRPAASTFVHKRRDGDRHMLFVVNTHRERGQSYDVILPESLPGAVTRWDALTGAATPLPAAAAGGTRRIRLDLRPADSALLLIDPAQPGETAAVGTVAPGGEIVIPLAGPWDFRRSEPNVLVIDRLSATADDGKTVFAEDMDHRIRKRLAEHFGVEAALEWQPWMAERSGAFEGKGGPVVLSYRFRAEGKPPASAALVMEWHPKMRVTLNGTVVDFTNATAHWERNFRSVPVAGSIRTGENQIEVAFPYNHRAEIEPVYITGDFAVRLDGQDPVLAAEAPKLEAGSWVGQGLPFYSGEITCTMPFEQPAGHVRLRLRDPRGTLFRFRVNGQDAGKILWAPYELDLTPFLQPGTNRLDVTVVGSRQNTFGPLHDRESDGEGAVASPFHYESESSLREQWSLHDYGLMGGAELVCS